MIIQYNIVMEKKGNIVAVLTADMVKSSLMDVRFKQHLLQVEVKNFLEQHTQLIDYQVYRGEEFGQLKGINVSFIGDGNNVAVSLMHICARMGANFTIANPEDALLVASLLRTFIITRTPDEQRYKRLLDVRIAIGIGKTSELAEHDGEAYILSGHLMDKIGKQRVAVVTAWKEINEVLSIHAMTVDAIISKWSKRQGEIMLDVLLDVPREQILLEKNISSSTLSSFLKKSDAKLLKSIILHASKVIIEKTDFQDV